MHSHDHEAPESLRPKASRIDDTEPATAARAAAEGRWDVVGPAGMAQLQRSIGNSGVVAALQRDRDTETDHGEHDHAGHDHASPVHDVVSSGGGRPLEPEVRTDMEARLGADFGDVRVHDDSRAHDSAVGVNAHAYTAGSNIVFQRDRYDPSSPGGQVTLAHELTHVMQQRNGPVDGTPAAGGISVSDPGDRFEREASANAERVMSAPAPTSAPTSDSAAPVQREAAVDGPVVQREADEDEEPADVQGSFVDAPVQREEMEEEPAEA